MRLRLLIHRPGLSSVKLLWNTNSKFRAGDERIVSTLLARVNDVIPLECAQSGVSLYHYVVEIDGFEVLHFEKIEEVLNDGDQVIVRIRTDSETREAERCGRIQAINSGLLFDGTPFGHAFTEDVRRPEVFIPARKRTRTGLANESTLRIEPTTQDESDGEGEEGEEGEGGEEEPSAQTAAEQQSSALRKDLIAQIEESERLHVESSTRYHASSEADSDSDSDDESYQSDSSDSSSNDEPLEYDSKADDVEAGVDLGELEQQESSAEEEDERMDGAGEEGERSAASASPPPETSSFPPAQLVEPHFARPTESAVSSFREEPTAAGLEDRSSSSEEEDPQPLSPTVEKRATALGTLPHQGSRTTRARKLRKRYCRLLNRLKEEGVFNHDVGIHDVRKFLDLYNLNVDTPISVIKGYALGISSTPEQDVAEVSNLQERHPLQETSASARHGADNRKDQREDVEMRNLDGVENAAVKQGRLLLTKSARKRFKQARAKGKIPRHWTIEEWMEQKETDRRDSGGQSQELPVKPDSLSLVEALGLQNPAQDQTSQLRSIHHYGKSNKKWKQLRNKQPTKVVFDDDGNVLHPAAHQEPEEEQHESSAEQPASGRWSLDWRSKIRLKAIECELDNVQLPTPSFPFNQDQLAEQRGKKRKRGRGNENWQGEEGLYPNRCQQESYPDEDRQHERYDYDENMYDDPAPAPEPETRPEKADDPVEDDFPPLPDNIESYPPLELPIRIGTIFACKRMVMVNYQPSITEDFRRAQVLEVALAESDNPWLRCRIPKSDIPKKTYDPETGERILGKFEIEMEDGALEDEFEADFSNLYSPRVVVMGPEPESQEPEVTTDVDGAKDGEQRAREGNDGKEQVDSEARMNRSATTEVRSANTSINESVVVEAMLSPVGYEPEPPPESPVFADDEMDDTDVEEQGLDVGHTQGESIIPESVHQEGVEGSRMNDAAGSSCQESNGGGDADGQGGDTDDEQAPNPNCSDWGGKHNSKHDEECYTHGEGEHHSDHGEEYKDRDEEYHSEHDGEHHSSHEEHLSDHPKDTNLTLKSPAKQYPETPGYPKLPPIPSSPAASAPSTAHATPRRRVPGVNYRAASSPLFPLAGVSFTTADEVSQPSTPEPGPRPLGATLMEPSRTTQEEDQPPQPLEPPSPPQSRSRSESHHKSPARVACNTTPKKPAPSPMRNPTITPSPNRPRSRSRPSVPRASQPPPSSQVPPEHDTDSDEIPSLRTIFLSQQVVKTEKIDEEEEVRLSQVPALPPIQQFSPLAMGVRGSGEEGEGREVGRGEKEEREEQGKREGWIRRTGKKNYRVSRENVKGGTGKRVSVIDLTEGGSSP